MTEGTILHTQRLSTEDGPGNRTTVFMKGCLLNCAWCHNPESIAAKPEMQRIETNCLGCGTCIKACPQGCIQAGEDDIIFNRALCDACGICAEVCPTGAWEKLGTKISVDALTQELLKDRSYFAASTGGVTFSGGEPALQADFVSAVMQNLQAAGVHTALDTCGMVNWQQLEKMLPFSDLVLFDVKLIESAAHKKHTGQPNQVILENLRKLKAHITKKQPQTKLWIRTPLIPGATDGQANLNAIGDFIAAELGEIVERWELCAFNNLCQDKYRRLGMDWDYAETRLYPQSELDKRLNWAQESAFLNERIIQTGAARVLSKIGDEA